MKFQVTMKDTDVLYEAVNEAVDEELKATNLDEDEKDAIRELRQEKYGNVTSKWFQYGEYLTVEIDTEAQSIRVVPVSEFDR